MHPDVKTRIMVIIMMPRGIIMPPAITIYKKTSGQLDNQSNAG
jgi:hypothetical protein